MNGIGLVRWLTISLVYMGIITNDIGPLDGQLVGWRVSVGWYRTCPNGIFFMSAPPPIASDLFCLVYMVRPLLRRFTTRICWHNQSYSQACIPFQRAIPLGISRSHRSPQINLSQRYRLHLGPLRWVSITRFWKRTTSSDLVVGLTRKAFHD